MDHQDKQAQQQQQPLANRSTNTHLSTSSSMSGGDCAGDAVKAQDKTMPLKPNGLLRSGVAEKNQSHYISPSDGIMSPCTKKLSDLKGKRFKSAGKPQSLFAKTIRKRSMENANAEKGSSSEGSQGVEGGGDEDVKME